MKKDTKVLISGMNIISSLGLNLTENWDNLVKGKSGVKRITLFDPNGLETQIAAQVPDTFEEFAATKVKKRQSGQMTRVIRMCLVCAKDTIEQEEISFDTFDKSRVAVILGVVNTGNSSVEGKDVSRSSILKGMNNAMSAWISMEYGLTGPSYTVATACSSSAYAIALGYDLIKSGKADMVITGGADSIINPEEITGFNHLFALSTQNDPPETASKPFSEDRDGFVVGEGAGIMILESEVSAKKRSATIYGELAGYALTTESYNIMAPKKDGEGMAETMKKALADVGVDASEVDYISAHGTSTMLNDLYETMAIKKVFGDKASSIAVSSQKSMIGHTVGAAGVIEGIVSTLSIRNGILTPTINLHKPDPELDMDFVPNVSRKANIRVALSNSFAFGGHNATLVFRKYE
ncbi:MAG: beta-ketoacyl-[acyl-carrier-protein] synthase family protein [Marinilabiliales bacterium]|nr:MAG: beta-ketoacyl-[acyl-carrier-protein] synthase family protein [Marinilabiliales bacterium]